MSDKERLLEHEYDGIKEYDNPTPRWWTWIFWVSVVFSIVYVVDPRQTFAGPGREEEYKAQLQAAEARWPKPAGGIDAAALAALAADPNAIALGKTTFGSYCASCHRADGGGLIGPNLTDDYWLHGGKLTDIHKTITEGVLAKGMPPWQKLLKPEQINAVTAYVASLHDSHPKDAKAPEGTKVEDDDDRK